MAGQWCFWEDQSEASLALIMALIALDQEEHNMSPLAGCSHAFAWRVADYAFRCRCKTWLCATGFGDVCWTVGEIRPCTTWVGRRKCLLETLNYFLSAKLSPQLWVNRPPRLDCVHTKTGQQLMCARVHVSVCVSLQREPWHEDVFNKSGVSPTLASA